jgi:hypothetical protein
MLSIRGAKAYAERITGRTAGNAHFEDSDGIEFVVVELLMPNGDTDGVMHVWIELGQLYGEW